MTDFFTFDSDWKGLADFGFVSNNLIRWKKVGEDFPIHAVVGIKEGKFECVCFDLIVRYFTYYKFTNEEFKKLSDYDKCHLKKVYF